MIGLVGLFDLQRKIRPVGKAYKELIADWSEALPTQSVCLAVPLDFPDAEISSLPHGQTEFQQA